MNYAFHASFLGKSEVATQTFECTFKIDPSFTFRSGQYVWIVLPSLNSPDPRGARRAFSITNSPEKKGLVSVVFRASSSGFKQTLLGLHEGDAVSIEGPFGSSYVAQPDASHPAIFIAGGSGIAPFLSYIRSDHTIPFRPFTVITSNTSHETTCFVNEVAHRAQIHHFAFINHIGPCEECPLIRAQFTPHTQIYICGPKHFVHHVHTQLLGLGLLPDQMHFEQFYPEPQDNLTPEEFIKKTAHDSFMLRAIEDSKNHVVITDTNGYIIYANPTAQKNTGYTFAEMRGNTPRLWGGLMSPAFYKTFWQQKKQTGGFDGEIVNRRKNGETYHVLAHISPIFNEQNRIVGYIGTEEDITYRFELEQNLRQEKLRTEAMLVSLGEGVIAHDKHEQVVFINPAAREMLGFEQEDFEGRRFVDVVLAEDLLGNPIPVSRRPITRSRGQLMKVVETICYKRKNGTKFIARVVNSPIIIHGVYAGSIQIMNDVTKEREIDRAKTEFISLASHQLRTPLSTINWYTEMLLNGDAGPITTQQKSFLDEIYTGSQRLVKMVNSLLNVSRIESNTFMIEPEQVDIFALIQSVIGESRPSITAKHLNVRVIPATLPHMLLDLNLTTMIFQNLLTNAIKYTNGEGTIEISARLVSQGEQFGGRTITSNILGISVADDGMGIPENQQHEIFQKLFRADNVKRADTEGTGLGLYLIKSLIEHCQGAIWFVSHEQKGTTFFVTLPATGMPKKEGTRKLNE